MSESPHAQKGSPEFTAWLLSLSMAPLFLLAIAVSLTHVATGLSTPTDMKGQNCVLICQIVTCTVSALALLVAAATSARIGKARNRRSGPGAFEIESIEKNGEEAITFFFAIIVPTISIAISTDVAASVCFWLLIATMVPLLVRTGAGFWNPVLVMYGYKLYDISLVGFGKGYRLVSEDELSEGDSVLLTRISNQYFFARKRGVPTNDGNSRSRAS